jgi:hypothetical protein
MCKFMAAPQPVTGHTTVIIDHTTIKAGGNTDDAVDGFALEQSHPIPYEDCNLPGVDGIRH